MHFRKNKSRKAVIVENEEINELLLARKATKKPDQIIDRLQLNQAIEQLADGYRRILVMHDVPGYEHKEIAKSLNCADGTSKSQLHKARRKLRQLLVPNEISP